LEISETSQKKNKNLGGFLMETQDNINQQERMAAAMRQQQQMFQQQQYMAYKQNAVMQIVNGLQQIDPFEVINMVNYYHGISTFQMEPNESNYLLQLIGKIFGDPNADFTLDNWKDLINILNNSISLTGNLRANMIGSANRGAYGFNQYGGMGQMGGMGMGMGYQQPMMGPQMGMGFGMGQMGGMGMGGMPYQQPIMGGMNQYGMMGQGMGYGMGYQPFNTQQKPNQEETEETRIANGIAECKQIFFNCIWNVDPIIFINCLLQGSFELKSQELENALRMVIGNSLWRLQDNALQMFFNIVSTICNNEYQKRMSNPDNKQNQQFNPNFQQPMMGQQMGMGFGMGQMGGMGMGGMPYQQPMMGMGQMGQMGGMGMGMGYQQPMMGPQMGMGGMMPPMNGMGMNGFGQFGMGGMPYQGMGGNFNQGLNNTSNRSARPMWD
jgi:hypothetical protein